MEFRARTKTDIIAFLEMAEHFPVVDVRSPAEFTRGHIPGAFSIPLFDDKERETVGIRYNKEGRIKAILEGLKLAGPSMSSKLAKGLELSVDGRLLVHCWRGGMRSEAMAWLFSLGDLQAEVLEGGYKSYRHHVIESLSANRKMIILGGLTGSGKTEILKHLHDSGTRVIDLEGLANHKGSAFGSLGQKPQPSSEQFANLLFDMWRRLDKEIPVWMEDESRNIGNVFMPEEFYLNMQKNPAIVLLMDINTRLPRLIREYSLYPEPELEALIMKISRRLGGDNARDAVQALQAGDYAKAIEITLKYYDKTYLYELKSRQGKNIVQIVTDTDDPQINAGKVLEAAKGIKW
jgi:tRNA 2-selenouridine synthase